MSDLLSPAFLFRFSVPCLFRRSIWSASQLKLSVGHRIPSFGELEGKQPFADLRAAWNRSGITFVVRVGGKKHHPWCRVNRVEESDGLRVWINTRASERIHRASRYCHQFAFLPLGAGTRVNEPVCQALPIRRAREIPAKIADDALKVRSELTAGGYRLEAQITGAALTGFDPKEHPHIGFTYAVVDRELGWQTFTVGRELPFTDDPSLWGHLELISSTTGSKAP